MKPSVCFSSLCFLYSTAGLLSAAAILPPPTPTLEESPVNIVELVNSAHKLFVAGEKNLSMNILKAAWSMRDTKHPISDFVDIFLELLTVGSIEEALTLLPECPKDLSSTDITTEELRLLLVMSHNLIRHNRPLLAVPIFKQLIDHPNANDHIEGQSFLALQALKETSFLIERATNVLESTETSMQQKCYALADLRDLGKLDAALAHIERLITEFEGTGNTGALHALKESKAILLKTSIKHIK